MTDSLLKETVKFYFSFNDPESFILLPAVKSLSGAYKINIDYIPVSMFDNEKLFSQDDAVCKYYKADTERVSKKADRKLKYIDSPQNSKAVCRAKFLADEKMLGLKYINLLFALRWLSGKDISNIADIIDGLKFLEFDDAEIKDALMNDKYKDALDETEKMAKADGVIGAPFLSFRGEGYLGADRLSYLEDILKSDPLLIIHHDAAYGVMSAEELKARLDKKEPTFVLDVRIPKDFSAGHVPGANCLTARIIQRNIERLDRDWTIVVVGEGGVDASETAFILASAGFKDVYALSQGYGSWSGEVETGLDKWQDKLTSS